MAAPSGTVWGSISGGYGKIGLYITTSSTNTATTATVEVWFWSKYSVSDSSNTLYFDFLSSSGSASTSKGSKSISTTVASGSGWSTSNQVKLGTYTSSAYTRGTSASTKYVYAKLTNVDVVGSTMYVSKTFSVPKLATYTVSYNANGGSGAPSAQTKYYGKSITLSTTKPTRTGYTFLGWATSSSATSANSSYDPGDTYSTNAALTLYAVWKANTYSVTYNANGGSGAPSAQTKTYGVTLTLSSTKPTRTNYTFKGWGTSASATTVSYAAGASYTKNAAITLYAIWELTYTKPKISGFSLSRCDSSGNVTDSGTCALVKFSWSTSISVTAVTIEHRQSGSETWSTITVATSGTSSSVSKIVDSVTFNTENTYDFCITINDGTSSVTKLSTLDALFYPIDVLSGGTGVAFGKAAELEDTADFGFDVAMRRTITFANDKCIYGTRPDGTVFEVINPQNQNGNLVLGYDSYEQATGLTNICGHDINFGISNIATPSYYRPYRRQGDVLSLTLRTTGYVTNSGKDISFWIPMSEPIVGNPTVTISSGNGFVLRQNNKYTHGSSASVYVTPSSYEASRISIHGIYVKAVFTDTTNVTNNDPIGIYWDGTITFS